MSVPAPPHGSEELLVVAKPSSECDGTFVVFGNFGAQRTKTARCDQGTPQTEPDIKLLLPSVRRIRQPFQNTQGAGKVLYGFTPGGAAQSKFACALPMDCGRPLQTCFGSVTRHHFWLTLGYFWKRFLDRLRDARVESPARAAEQGAIGRIPQ